MTGFNPIMMLFEGICPSCNAEIEIIRIGGTPWFHEQYGITAPDVKPDHWEFGVTSEGEVEWKCEKGHIHCAGASLDGDWNL